MHTPGPWHVRETGTHWNNRRPVNLEITHGSDGECVADTVYETGDAHLISAAPDLLEALRFACIAHHSTHGTKPPESWLLAIAKAEGR